MPTPGARFDELVRIMARLRAPDGCPWDRAQTLASLRPFLLEETYEALDAIDRGDPAALCEELGDLLFEVVFLARIAEDEGAFTLEQAVDGVARKLVRRHPHVFGDAPRLESPDQVVGRWEALKAAERGGQSTPRRLLDGVSQTLPALLQAYEYGDRAAAVGFDWTRAADVLDKIDEEARELREVVEAGDGTPPARLEEEMGDLLFAIANLSRKLGIEPEAALRRANAKFRDRFGAIESRVAARGQRLQDLTLDELEAEWEAVKRE